MAHIEPVFKEAYWDENRPDQKAEGEPVSHPLPTLGDKRKQELTRWLIFLNTSARYDQDEEIFCFPDGTAASEGFNSAVLTSLMFGGEIVTLGGNVRAGRNITWGEHSFALVDGRYAVDYWLAAMDHGFEPQPCGVFDLEDSADLAAAESFYGPRDGWKGGR